MVELNFEELSAVSGGDAAATRQPGQNSWGEYPTGGGTTTTSENYGGH